MTFLASSDVLSPFSFFRFTVAFVDFFSDRAAKMKMKKSRITKVKRQLFWLYGAANQLVKSKEKVKIMTFGDSQLRRYQSSPDIKRCFVQNGFKRPPRWNVGLFPKIFPHSKFQATHISLSGMGFRRSNHPLVILKRGLTESQRKHGI
jgi:hypothetical protein